MPTFDDQLAQKIDSYIESLFVPSDPILSANIANADAAGLPPINVSPNQGKLLYLLARIADARRVLEIGTLGGYSTTWLARALPTDGRLITLEFSPVHAVTARKNLTAAGLAGIAEVVVGDAGDSMNAMIEAGEAPFDLIFIDADKPSTPDYFAWALRLSRPGSLIITDNVVRNGALADAASTDPNVIAMRRFHEILSAEPRVSATTIQTVGCKGYDGFTLVLVVG